MHFMKMLGTAIGNQLELAYLTGVALPSGGPAAADVNQLFNGWEYNILNNGGHVVDGSTVGGVYSDRYLSTDKLNKLIKVVPTKYRTQAMDYRFLVSPNTYQDFIELVGNRATPFGDIAYQSQGYEATLPFGGNSVLGWGRIPMYPVPLLPENEFVATSGANAASTTLSAATAAGATSITVASDTNIAAGTILKVDTGGLSEVVTVAGAPTGTAAPYTVPLTTALVYAHNSGVAVVAGTNDGTFIALSHFRNLIVGIQRDIRIELDRRPRERATYAVVTLRVDCNMENPDAAAIMHNLAIKP